MLGYDLIRFVFNGNTSSATNIGGTVGDPASERRLLGENCRSLANNRVSNVVLAKTFA